MAPRAKSHRILVSAIFKVLEVPWSYFLAVLWLKRTNSVQTSRGPLEAALHTGTTRLRLVIELSYWNGDNHRDYNNVGVHLSETNELYIEINLIGRQERYWLYSLSLVLRCTAEHTNSLKVVPIISNQMVFDVLTILHFNNRVWNERITVFTTNSRMSYIYQLAIDFAVQELGESIHQACTYLVALF